MASSNKAQDPTAAALLAIEEVLNLRAAGQGAGPAEANPIGATSADNKAADRAKERVFGEREAATLRPGPSRPPREAAGTLEPSPAAIDEDRLFGPAHANAAAPGADSEKERLKRLLGELDEPDLERFVTKGILAKEDLERLLVELGGREAATSRRAFRSNTDDPTRWLVTLFPVSAGAFVIGLLSALYIVLAGFSTIALAGAYLIPLGLTALYYLLGAAERRAS
jgi:hypothetical protein